MNALDILQEATVADYPTVAQVISGEYIPPPDEVVLVVRRKGRLFAAGPYSTKDVEWERLLPSDRVFPGNKEA